MNIVRFALRHPVTIAVVVLAITLSALLALVEMPRDILPSLGIPTIYIAQPYGGLSPAQMESYLTYYYEYHFLYISGIEHIESKNIASTALIKLQFYPEPTWPRRRQKPSPTSPAPARSCLLVRYRRSLSASTPGALPSEISYFPPNTEV